MATFNKTEYQKHYRAKNHERLLDYHKNKYRALRRAAIEVYAEDTEDPACACCGENIYKFLTLDHINNDGAEHRRRLATKYIFSWLKTNNYPEGFQVLCYNCNLAKGYYGLCPHEGEYQDV